MDNCKIVWLQNQRQSQLTAATSTQRCRIDGTVLLSTEATVNLQAKVGTSTPIEAHLILPFAVDILLLFATSTTSDC